MSKVRAPVLILIFRKIADKVLFPILKLYWRIFKPKTRGARVLILDENKVLLVQSIGSSLWRLPGGGCKKGESYFECAQREIYEEVGVKGVSSEKHLGTYFSNQEGKRDSIVVFIAEIGNPEIKTGWEIENHQWFDSNDLPANISPATVRRIREYKDGKVIELAPW